MRRCNGALPVVLLVVAGAVQISTDQYRSVREGPQTQFLLGNRPQLGQAVRLNNQEPDNQATEHHQFNVRHGGGAQLYADQIANRWRNVP